MADWRLRRNLLGKLPVHKFVIEMLIKIIS